MKDLPRLDQYPIKTHDKIRYGDTDRQGHVNNAVFVTMLQTGRVEILYNLENPLASPGCAFMIVSLTLNFHAEITWPGKVDIGTRIAKIGRSSITMEQGLFQQGKCVATASVVTAHIHAGEKRSEPINAAALQVLNALR